MMQEYYVDANSDEKVYGISSYLDLNDNTKTLGGISKDKYMFHINIGDHYCEHENIKEAIGSFEIYFSTYNKGDITEIIVSWTKPDVDPSYFQYECILGIINECIGYLETHTNKKIRMCVSDLLFEDHEYRETDDLTSIASDINEMMGYYHLA